MSDCQPYPISPCPPTHTSTPPPDPLPPTGADVTMPVALGGSLLLVGVAALVMARKRLGR